MADLVWERFGNVPNYVEPFFGSGAVLLSRTTTPAIETVNDLDCMVANFWRALQHDPEAVAYHADSPVNEADQHARHLWLCSQEEFRERMKTEPEFYDAKIAGWWVWGQCIWIGSGWCSAQLNSVDWNQLPHLGNAGRGVNRKLPHLGNAGTGVHRKEIEDAECVSDRTSGTALLGYMQELAERLRRVRVCCGDWSRVVTPAVTSRHGITGIFLDPPYTEGDFDYSAGGCGGMLAKEVAEWAVCNGDDRNLRIALCGYEGEHEIPPSWECCSWIARKGYQAKEDAVADRKRERIWFSPHCLRNQGKLF